MFELRAIYYFMDMSHNPEVLFLFLDDFIFTKITRRFEIAHIGQD